MSARKTILLRRIISHFASTSQMQRYDELVEINKGSASHFAFRLLEEYFEKKFSREKTGKSFIVNGYGKSWIQKL